jgi:hypothetical protein
MVQHMPYTHVGLFLARNCVLETHICQNVIAFHLLCCEMQHAGGHAIFLCEKHTFVLAHFSMKKTTSTFVN